MCVVEASKLCFLSLLQIDILVLLDWNCHPSLLLLKDSFDFMKVSSKSLNILSPAPDPITINSNDFSNKNEEVVSIL